jgi:hypothetical protein
MKQKNEFSFRRDRRKAIILSKNEILDELRRFGEVCRNKMFTTREYDAWDNKRLTSASITRLFGTWSKAMTEAGLKPSRVWKKDIPEMVETFKQCWMNLGSEPTGEQFKSYLKRVNSPYKWSSYKGYFGSMGRLAQRIEDHDAGKISDDQLYERHTPKRNRRTVPLNIRYSILKRDGEKCVLCGASPKNNSSVVLEVDHIIPVSKGGDDSLSNLRTLCKDCNQGKKDKDA